ncbi:phage terminase large subunit [Desulforegula conservatrix]|uniref:phage terminase large subunit n=1 Tax=Desulforegula conservatrix TaxID=153026 RepID=UPI0004156C6E|nr:phage terminase large subunit [Desulforegula conservatrix]
MSVKIKQFNKEIEALRELILKEATPLPDGKKAREERRKRAASDLEFFGKTYFPHYLQKPNSKLHKYMYERFAKMILTAHETGEGDKEADAAPRGNAKSTTGTLILPLWCTAFGYRRFIVLVSDTATQAFDFLAFIKTELEFNERLKQDFPEICGEGSIWRTDNIVTANGVRMAARGAGQKLRGLRHGARRPDLVIGDDLENDESVVSPDQRAKLEQWFFRALMKIGKPYTVYIVVGTILHYDSLLSKLLKKPGWKGRKFKSVISWSKSKLWDEWISIFTDARLEKEEAEAKADAYFKEHMEEMLEGAEVLWPEEEPYYYLMKMRVSDGPAHFDSEKQNEPINPDDCLFQEEWIAYWPEDLLDSSENGLKSILSGLPLYAAVDPSLGKKSRKSDPSAILGGRFKDKVLYLEMADIEKRHPDRIIDDVLTYHDRLKIHMAGVETVQFQQFFKDTLEKIAHERGQTLNVVEIPQSGDKIMRIQRLQPWIKNGWIRFKPNMRTLIDQLIKFPMADHDDGPDALEMLLSLVEKHSGKFAGVEVMCAMPLESAAWLRGYND